MPLGILLPFLEEMSLTDFTPATATEALGKFGISTDSAIGKNVLQQAARFIGTEEANTRVLQFSANTIIEHFRNLATTNNLPKSERTSRQDYLNNIRNIRQLPKSGEYLKAVPNAKTFNPSSFAPANYDFPGNYRVKVRIEGISSATGEKVTRWVTVTFNDPTQKDTLYSIAEGMLGADPSSYEIIPTGMVADQGLKNPYVPGL